MSVSKHRTGFPPRGHQCTHATWLVVLLVCGACQDAPPEAVIGIGMSTESAAVQIAVAREELSESGARRSGAFVRFVEPSMALEGRGSAHIAVRRANQLLATPNLVAVVGHAGSRATLFAAPLYNEAGVPHIAHDATSSLIQKVGPWTFMLADDDGAQGSFITSFIDEECAAESVSIFYVSDEYGIGLRDGILRAVQSSPIEVLDQIPFDESSDLGALVQASLNGKGRPDVVIIAGRTTAAVDIVHHAFALSSNVRFVASDGVHVAAIRNEISEETLDALFVVGLWHAGRDDEVSRRFVERFKAVTGREPTPMNALAHDALLLLAAAAGDVGPSREAIREYLLELGVTRPPYPGVTGPVSFQPHRTPRLLMVHAGTERVVYTPDHVRANAP